MKLDDRIEQLCAGWPPRLSPADAMRFGAQSQRTLKTLRELRRVTFYRTGHRSICYSTRSLAALLAAGEVEAVPVE